MTVRIRARGFRCLAAAVLAATFAPAQPVLLTTPAAPIGGGHPLRIEGLGAGAPYVLDLSLAGTAPGTPLGTGLPFVPLNRPFVHLDLFGASPVYAGVFAGFIGTADAQGRATPVLNLPADAGLIGAGFDAAFAAAAGASVIAGGPARVVIVPGLALPAGAAAPFVPPPPAGAPTRYVSPSGNDANSGLTPQAAWRQISHAATQVGAGDVVEIADGAYAGPVIIRYLHGTAAAPVVFRASGSTASTSVSSCASAASASAGTCTSAWSRITMRSRTSNSPSSVASSIACKPATAR